MSSLFIFAVILVLSSQPAWARAGGGGGGKGGGIINLILLPILLIYSALLTHKVRKKNRECLALLEKIEQSDPAWNVDRLKHRVDQVYFKVQEAWRERDQDIAKSYMSPALFDQHKIQTDQMIAQHERNVLEKINLIETDLVDVEDFTDNERDQFWVYLKGSMIDYTIDDRTNERISGKREVEEFTELWKFIRSGNNWVLDEIDQKVSFSHLRRFKVMSEG
jgi:predicted lipid-binding transport protein (Tim44 family)